MGWYPFNPLLGQKMQSDAMGRLVDSSYLAHLQFSAAEAVVADVDGIHAAINASAAAVVDVITAITNPTVAKNITATVGGTAASIKAVKVTITGTNDNDEIITEDLPAFTVDTAGTVTGSKAFKTITKISIPAMDGDGVTVTVGYGEKLGIPYKLAHNTCLMAFLNNVKEGTAPTITTDSAHLENNTIDLNSALNGQVVDAYFVV